MFMNKIRTRSNFDFNWRNVREDRTLENVKNSCDYTIAKQSMWPLDAREDFVNGPMLISGSGPTHINGQYGEGELQNDYTIFHMRPWWTFVGDIVSNDDNVLKPGALYNRKFPARKPPDPELFGGDALWEAPMQAGKYPFTQTYEEWTKDLKYVAKDYTIIPEFRISEHMDFYVNEKNGDFLADNPNMFSLTGSGILNSSTESFFRTYSHSDFMKYFGVVKKDYAEIDTPKEIALKCKGFIKFLPYNGFYPAQRSVELVNLFSSSLDFDDSLGKKRAMPMSMLLKPLFAPGLFFNMIKSGIAVDYPIISDKGNDPAYLYGATAGFVKGSVANGSEDSSIPRLFASFAAGHTGFDVRLPFETLLEPISQLSDIRIYAGEPHPSASLFNNTGHVSAMLASDGIYNKILLLYQLYINNFFAEVPNFFLKNQQLTSVVSDFEIDKNLLDSHDCFAMELDLRVYRSTFSAERRKSIMYNTYSAFGPPVETADKYYTFAPYTAPYSSGFATLVIAFEKDPAIDTYTIESILQNTSIVFMSRQIDINSLVPGSTGITEIANYEFSTPCGVSFGGTSTFSGLGSAAAMQLTASLNLFQLQNIKSVEFDALTGRPLNVIDNTQNKKAWVIQTKFETPYLSFFNATRTLPALNYNQHATPLGLWHQYGETPTDSQKQLILKVGDSEIATSNNIGSLADLVGFEKKSYPIGQVAEQKIISEAIVAVPFIIESNIPKFFNISKDMIRKAKLIAKGVQAATLNEPFPGVSIVEMVSKMEKYVFPPKMDFLKNESVEPFAMYIFEFEHVLSQKDLADIWQNLPPDIMDRFEEKEVKISHPLLASALLKEMPDELRWMVFKVKKKANWNYYKLTADSRDDNRFKFDFELGRQDSQKGVEPSYSYNWPYDFFSLVELAQIEASVKIGEDYEANREELFRKEELLNNDEKTPELSPIDKAKRKAAEEYLSQVNERINVPSTVQYGDQLLRERTMRGNEQSDVGSSGPGTGPGPGIGPGGPGFNLPDQSNIPVDDSGRNRRPGRNSQVTTQNTPSNTARNPAANANSGITTSNSSNAASDADRGGRGSNNVTSNNIGGVNNAGSRKGRRRGR